MHQAFSLQRCLGRNSSNKQISHVIADIGTTNKQLKLLNIFIVAAKACRPIR